MKKTFVSLFIATIVITLVSCGGGEVKVSEKGQMLIDHSWKLQIQDVINEATGNVKDETGVNADIKLDGDVADFANFLAETITFARDNSDKTKLAYERKIGEGLFSSSVVGWWELSEDEKYIIMKEWDSNAGAEKAGVKYEIKELTNEKLVILKEGYQTPNIYMAK